ncbi:MAG: ATPase P [Firmicutes bacterium]|nr:ATPase P [Bacillota bacterium]
MLRVEIPGRGPLELEHLVLDFTGTLSRDGSLLPGVRERLEELARHLKIYVLTADTFGTAREACRGLPAEVRLLEEPIGGPEKGRFVRGLGAGRVVAVGNGANDAPMVREAALGIVVLGPEGAAVQAALAADVLVRDVLDGLDLLLHPRRLVATLRG